MKTYKISIFSILLILFSLFSMAQPPDDGGFPVDEEDIPLDGGVTLLIASGIALGAKKYMSKK